MLLRLTLRQGLITPAAPPCASQRERSVDEHDAIQKVFIELDELPHHPQRLGIVLTQRGR